MLVEWDAVSRCWVIVSVNDKNDVKFLADGDVTFVQALEIRDALYEEEILFEE